MEIVLVGEKVVIDYERISLGGKGVGVLQGVVKIEENEFSEIIEKCNKIWKKIIKIRPDFRGLIRFDLVPILEKGNLKIRGIFEVNAHSPECVAAIAAILKEYPQIKKFIGKDPLERLVERLINFENLILVIGEGKVKKQWGHYLIDHLKERLTFKVMTPEELLKRKEEVLKKDIWIWRWGDARGISENDEFSKEFQEFLRNYPYVFNSMPKKDLPFEGDVSHKGILIEEGLVGESRFLNKENLEWAIEKKNNLVLKPLRGSSGKGIFFGKKEKEEKWKNLLENCLDKEYGIFEFFPLPKIRIREKNFIFDFNATFWAERKKLEFLYSIVRIKEEKEFLPTLVINVSRGGGMAVVKV